MCLTLLVDGVLVMDVGLAIFEVADKVEEDCVEAFEVEDEAAEAANLEEAEAQLAVAQGTVPGFEDKAPGQRALQMVELAWRSSTAAEGHRGPYFVHEDTAGQVPEFRQNCPSNSNSAFPYACRRC